ncbi:MAG: hypothetical protein PHC86_09485 [Eubacteriales bacterium]|nr:hypothetical protein [Eubacteriales bacterium]
MNELTDKPWQGLDFLRGLGIFCLLILHTAFYYFSGLWDLDLANPPVIITIIGFLLMFAGLFAIISGAAHGISIHRLYRIHGWSFKRIAHKKLSSGLFILLIAYIYFIFTGPGLSEFANRRMNNSILVEWIRNGNWAGFNVERLLYVDSLVMIGCNILLVSLIWLGLMKINQLKAPVLLGLAGMVLLLSLVRLPLYPLYLQQVSQKNWFQVLLLNWLVNKNNPILPFLAFGLLGSWLGLLLEAKKSRRPALLLGVSLLLLGVVSYIFLPDTMLQREIDLKWYSIMITQMGLFILIILVAIAAFDRKSPQKAPNAFIRFFLRFGTAGLTAFFWESVVAAIAWRGMTALAPGLQLGIGSALSFGLGSALFWGIILIFWEKKHYIGTIEYLYTQTVRHWGEMSSKAQKLRQP